MLEINNILSEYNLPTIDAIAYEDLINYYMTDGNPLFLLCISVKLIEELKAANEIYNDYYTLRSDYAKFKNEAVNMINEHTKLLEEQAEAIQQLSRDYHNLMRFQTAGKPKKTN